MNKKRHVFPSPMLGFALVLALAVGIGPAAASSTDPVLDPVVSEIVEMLNAGVSDSLILQWLESTDRRPLDVGSQGLIALTEAEASEQLITALLTRVEKQHTEGRVEVPESPSEPAARAQESPEPEAAAGPVEALVRLSAKRVWVDEEEPDSPREPRWDVFLYLDGELIAWTRPDAKGEAVEAHRVIPTGRREMRVVLQRYEELRRGWSYESLAVPTTVVFDAQPGKRIEIEIDMSRIWGLWRDRKSGGPMSYLIRQGDAVLAESDGAGGNPDHWKPVCEDVEANFPDAAGVPGAFRNPMSRCIRWAELWTGSGKATSRAEILEQLAEYDFAPPLR